MRRKLTPQQARVVVGWTEVWTTTPADGFELEGSVPIKRPRLFVQVENGHYRFKERRTITPPQQGLAA